MPEQIFIGNFAKGLTTSRLPFVIDNDAFPTMFNFYSWRGRARRKRGTIFLGQLQQQEQIAAVPLSWQLLAFALDGAGNGNLITQYSLGATSSITPGVISLIVGANTYTDPAQNGNLVGAPGGTGTINYATGAFNIVGGGASIVTGTFSYFPGLPVMGLRDFDYIAQPNVRNVSTIYPFLLAFDTKYAYQLRQNIAVVNFYDVSYYKITNNPVVWSGADFQQFWTTNDQSALWATNNKPGFHFKSLVTPGVSVTAVSPTRANIGIPGHGLIVNDLVWINEVTGTIAPAPPAPSNSNINGLTGQVTMIIDANNVQVDFLGVAFTTSLSAFAGGATGSGGIAQYLTNSIAGQDGIKWYDGDPTNTTGLPTTTALGWVNFAPPLTGSAAVSLDEEVARKYYLVGALAVLPFKDRLLFFSPWIQASSGPPIQLKDTVLWSWNGTPYYTAITPFNETNDVRAYYQDQTGLGGNLPAGISLPIATITNNEDVLLIGFGGRGRKTRFVYTGNDLDPFLFFNINSELPSDSTFSAVTLDKGAIDIGAYGIAMTDQQSAQRVDLDIPDSVFQIKAQNNGAERVNSIRDFFKEWIYFSYPVNTSAWRFPTQTFLFNYRDNTWGIQYENFTTHGIFRSQRKRTWLTTGFASWNVWREPWNSGASSPLFPNIIAGNPQGYVLIKAQGTGEAISGTIQDISNSLAETQITSIDHCVQVGDYLLITACLGTTAINDLIGRVRTVVDVNNFVIDLPFPAGIYLGLGKFTRLSQPLLQTKQFPVYWDQGRQTRLSCQKYLMDATTNGQVTVNVYLSQDPDDAWNTPIPPTSTSSLIYSQLMYTCPESTNIGLTPANTNLQMPTADGQFQIWHRFNTSLIGDSVQIGITLSDAQMRDLNFATSEITLQGMHLTVDKASHLA